MKISHPDLPKGKVETRAEYIVRCRRWVRNLSGEKVWETIDLGAADREQALQFYEDLLDNPLGALESPKPMVRLVTEFVEFTP